MPSKIFKSILYTMIMVLGVHAYTNAQDVTPAKEKDLEEKMKQMELKLQVMQQKLDSMKVNERKVPSVTTLSGSKPFKLYKTPPMPASPKKIAPLTPLAEGQSDVFSSGSGSSNSFSKAFDGFDRAMNKFSLKFESSDKNLQEKIKSGEVKEKVKTYTKSYNAGSGDKLQIDNRYGKVTVNTWNKNEFKVDVEIKGIANEDDEAQKLLDGITIADNKDGGVVSFKTTIESQNRTWGFWSNGGKSYVSKSEVNYTVYMPAKSSLEIANHYGGIILPSLDGKLTINAYYSSLSAKTLSNTDNEINTHYTDVDIESVNGGNVTCTYGSMVKIGTANNLTLDTHYIAAYIDKLKTSGNISVRYGGGLKINDMDKSLKNLTINSNYSPVLVGSKNNSFDFDVTVRYSVFKYDDDHTKVTSKSPADDERRYSSTKNYKGYVGKSNNDSKVTISSSYYPVQFQ